MSADSPPTAEPIRRLHPSSVVFGVGSAARRLLLPGLFVVFFRPGGQYEIWLMVLFVPAVLAAVAKYASYRYQSGPDELVVREGIVTRNERHIPYARIENIDLVQNVIHRLFGVAEVRIETAGGERPEAVMRVLSLGAIEEMRAKVFRDRESASAGAETEQADRLPPDVPLVQVGASDLALVGLTNHRGLALVAAAMGVLWQLDPWDDVDPGWIQDKLAAFDVPARFATPGPVMTAMLVVGSILLALLLLSALSIVWATLRYYGFTLRAHGDDLRSEYGLLTRITGTIPRQRIQQLTITRGPIHRWAKRASVEVETAGHAQDKEGPGVDRLWLAPMIAESRVEDLIRRVMPDVDPADLEWQPISARAWRRIVKKGVFAAVVLSALAGAVAWPWAIPILVVGGLLAAKNAQLHVKHAAYALTPNAVIYRSGWWNRRTSVVRYAKIQALELAANPFDRRNRMASVSVDTAGAGRMGHRLDIRYLESPVAADVMSHLATETGSRPFRW